MSRTSQYDPATVTAGAMELFWRHGFASASIDSLVRETGLNRHSLYRSFGGKAGLFASSLRYYRDHYARRYLALLRESRGTEGLRRYFAAIIESQDDRGCMIVNAALEQNLPDNCRAEIEGHYQELQGALYQALREGQEDGDIPASLHPGPTSRWLLAIIQGVCVRIRQRGEQTLDPADLMAIIQPS